MCLFYVIAVNINRAYKCQDLQTHNNVTSFRQ